MPYKKFLLISFISFISFLPAGQGFIKAGTVQELEAKLQTLRDRDIELQKKSQGFRSLIDETKLEIGGIKREITNLTYQINGLEVEILRTQNEIELATLQIEKLGLEIIKTLEQIEGTKSQTSHVLKKLYQAEQVSQIELVLSGDDFSDFWNQHQYFSNFQTSLNNLIYQFEALRSDLEQKTKEQEGKRVQLKSLEEQKAVQSSLLSEDRGHQQVVLAQNEGQKKEYEKNLANTEGERRRIIEEILRVEDEVKRLKTFELYLKTGKIPPAGTKLFSWPTSSRVVTQGYGATAFARSGVAGYRFHNGIDIGGGTGTAITAALQGKVVGKNGSSCPNYGRLRSFGCQGGWGNWIALEHPNGLITLYAHMAEPSSAPLGGFLKEGESIGFIGSSGNVTGPHLHFSVYTEFFLVPAGYPGYNPEGTLNPLLYL
ncbi:MAG: peptidoglycan DD-metalloendopeptidase family protein [Candidatus Portnoybacteria bacterium]|nr:peptidoglycan DD-metalloendopeptidase family protein [Candidatus Portnoybacteria bacterium]